MRHLCERIFNMKHFIPTLFLLIFFTNAFAWQDTTFNIPLSRQSRHDDIKKEQANIDALDGKLDGVFTFGNNDAANAQLTYALYTQTNQWRYWIEGNDTQLKTNNDKVRYLKYVADLLVYFRVAKKNKEIASVNFSELIQIAEKMMKAKAANTDLLLYLQQATYPVAKICNPLFIDAKNKQEANNMVYLKMINLYPQNILPTLAPFVKEAFADSLLIVACRLNPEKFYSYAQSPKSDVGQLIFKSNNSMVQQVAKLSQTPNALLYFPFLDDILTERQSIESIAKYVGDGDIKYDSVGYYKLLVNTAVAYYKRMAAPLKDTPVAYYGKNGLQETLRAKGYQHFVKHINDLHDNSNLAIRMKAIQPLTALELYYMITLSENEIYTSSYKHSFNRMLQLMGAAPRTDSLLLAANFNHFKKFIKMAANYNKLDTFLKLMPPAKAETLMKYFVAGLDNDNLEDAVDVADSYSSITDKKLLESMLQNVIDFENVAKVDDNKKAKVIYGLLKTIFLSLSDTSINLNKEVGIPPIYEVGHNYMRNTGGQIIEQVFFYGDKDGKDFYPRFRNTFAAKDWKVTDKKEWMEAVSIKGNVQVFANRPLNNDANLDDTAQVHLGKYLKEKGLKPNMIVHRGHSYWLPRTMDRMPGDAKIVLLGSCGGYQNLNKILEINPDAHIISTKEIGTGDINTPLFTYMNQAFMNSTDLSWKKMWQTLGKNFLNDPSKAVRDSWESYVPPYKNLGAIFLKAYALKMGDS